MFVFTMTCQTTTNLRIFFSWNGKLSEYWSYSMPVNAFSIWKPNQNADWNFGMLLERMYDSTKSITKAAVATEKTMKNMNNSTRFEFDFKETNKINESHSQITVLFLLRAIFSRVWRKNKIIHRRQVYSHGCQTVIIVVFHYFNEKKKHKRVSRCICSSFRFEIAFEQVDINYPK